MEGTTGVISRSIEYKPCSLLSVVQGYFLAFQTFLELMRRHWPSVDVASAVNAGGNLKQIGIALVGRGANHTRLNALLLELLSSWELMVSADPASTGPGVDVP